MIVAGIFGAVCRVMNRRRAALSKRLNMAAGVLRWQVVLLSS